MANPTLLDMPFARDGNKNVIPVTDNGTTGKASQQYGWQQINSIPPQQGGKAVKREDFNGALYLLSNLLFYAQKGWQFEWNSNQDYYSGCIVKDPTDGKMYRAKNDVTANNTEPHNDTANWELWDLSAYLPLSGGTMTGNIYANKLNNHFDIFSGPTQDVDDSWLMLFGKNFTGSQGAGSFILRTGGGKALHGKADGTLTWNENDLGGSAIVASYFGANSWYVKNAKGFIVQGGKVATSNMTAHTGARDTTVALPISFSNASTPLWCFTNPNRDGIQTPNVITWSYCNPTNVYIGTNNTADSFNITWVAMGW
jgi:hypothetical protein